MYFWQNIPEKWVSRNSRKKKYLSRPKIQQLQKIKKIEIFRKGLIHGFGQKLAIFPSFDFREKSQENLFGDILERKNAFLDYKDRKFTKSKTGIILKRLAHGFCKEMANCFIFFIFGKIGQKNVFQDILERKNAFLGYQNKSFKNSKK